MYAGKAGELQSPLNYHKILKIFKLMKNFNKKWNKYIKSGIKIMKTIPHC